MGSYRRGPPQPQFAFPPLLPWVRNILIGMAVLWAIELLLAYGLGLPIYETLGWTPGTLWETVPAPGEPAGVRHVQWGLEAGDVWQPFTHFLVQGFNPLAVVLNGLMVYLFLPFVRERFVPRHQLQLAIAAVAGAIGAGILWAGLCYGLASAGLSLGHAWVRVAALGMNPLISAALAVYGLQQLGRMVQMPFGPPFEGRWVFLFLVGLTVLFVLLSPGTQSIRGAGAFAAAVAWWYTLGPGGTRRRYKQAGRKVERQVTLRVVEGGKQDGDEWVN